MDKAGEVVKKMACVIGGSGNLASMLIKSLLLKGYAVNTTVRDPDNEKKTSHLKALDQLGDLKIFKGDLRDEGCFDAPIANCHFVFHVATPVNMHSEDPENEMIKPAIQGAVNVLKSCVKSKSVKRVIYTSSAAAVSIKKDTETGVVVDENDWTDIEYLTSEKPPTWGYPVSKTLAEKTAMKFAQENNIDLISVAPALISGPSLLPEPASSIALSLSLITGNEKLLKGLIGMQLLSGSFSLVHVEDVCEAHIFLAEKETARGRYICCAVNTSVPDLAKFLSERYPLYKVAPTDQFEGVPSKPKLMISSEKLVKEGFRFKYGVIEEIYDPTVDYCKSAGILK